MPDLIDRLPDYYKNSGEVIVLQGAYQHWTDAIHAAREDFFFQLDVATATWGLTKWEEAFGLETDVSKSDAFRRTRIISKIRGQGTSTVKMIQNVAESFSNGQVAIIEYNAEHRFEVKFVGTLGTPPNMDDLTAAIEDLKPAHLAYSYVYVYRTWGMVSAYTWEQLQAHTWNDVSEGDLS